MLLGSGTSRFGRMRFAAFPGVFPLCERWRRSREPVPAAGRGWCGPGSSSSAGSAEPRGEAAPHLAPVSRGFLSVPEAQPRPHQQEYKVGGKALGSSQLVALL